MTNTTRVISSCPIPIAEYPTILLSHGGGGRLTRQLIERMFATAFDNPILAARHDAATIIPNGSRMAFTTDSYVIRPFIFPGGDIGSLAVHGTINDLAMCGARPLYLSAGFILEEGLPMETLWRIVQSMRWAARRAGAQIVTGDTKVVDKGKGDGIFINTSGIGILEHSLQIAPRSVRRGDILLVNGDLGRHGIAIMAVREGLAFESTIASDSAPLADLVLRMIAEGIEIHCLRDLTRGGLASALNEIAEDGRAHIHLEERAIPVRDDVRGACEMLGLDPLYVANEGRFVAFVVPRDAARALALMRAHPLGTEASVIGTVTDDQPGAVTLTSAIGSDRILDMLSGEQLPRIC